ncbi:MAG: pilus assembly protein N-terminal domain-containing protein [Thermoanaerobaculia bacterium]
MKSVKDFPVVLVTVLVGLAAAAAAQDGLFEPLPVERLGLMTSTVGAGRLVTMPEQVERVALADERVARVQIISAREILLTGLKPGRTTLFVWLVDDRRLQYTYQVEWDLTMIQEVLWELDERIRIEASVDGRIITLRGEAASATVARQARERAESLLLAGAGGPLRVIDLLYHPDPDFSPDDRLSARLKELDERIEVRRIQVGPEPQADQDTYILEGRVKNVAALVKALTLAERQLGGKGTGVVPIEDQTFAGGRNRFFGFNQGSSNQNQGGLGSLGGLSRAPSGLAAQVSRGLVMSSASGRVLSFLVVDELPQILVSIRVLEIDRAKAKRAGINFRLDSEHYAFGSFTGPHAPTLPSQRGGEPTITGIAGNLAVGFVDQMTSISAAIDFLEDQQLARAVAEPNILTLAGEQASVVIGGEVPIPTTTLGVNTAVQGFFFQEFGVRLDIRPAIDDNDIITLEVSPSIIRPEFALSVSNVPGFTVQSVQTTARLYAGQSLVIGGLLDFEETVEERKLPFLGKIPLFRWKRRSRAQSELLFVISPRLVELEQPASPAEPIKPPPEDNVGLPELEWPEGREKWRNPFDPDSLGPDGLPPSFRLDLDRPVFDVEPEDLLIGEPQPAEDAAGPMAEAEEYETLSLEDPSPEETEDLEPLAEPDSPLIAYHVIRASADPCLNLREEPNFWFSPLDCLPPGTRVVVLEAGPEWSRVTVATDGREGWMATPYLELEP